MSTNINLNGNVYSLVTTNDYGDNDYEDKTTHMMKTTTLMLL